MARKRRGPTLLELIREPPPGGSFRVSPGGAPSRSVAPSDPGGGPGWWQMGARTVRLPVGYLFVAAGVALALTVVGYFIGYKRAEQDARAQRAREGQALVDSSLDPLNGGIGSGAPLAQTQSTPVTGAPAPGGTRQSQPQQQPAGQPPQQPRQPSGGQAPPATRPSDLERDPRVAGMNYLIIARLGPDEARKAAAYLQANGVDVAVIPTNSERFREVIATRGFAAGEVTGPERQRLESRIKELGRLYRLQERGPTDFSDMYPKRFSGR